MTETPSGAPRRQQPAGRTLPLILALPFLGIGLFVAFWLAPRNWLAARASQSFIETPGQIESCEVEHTGTSRKGRFRVELRYSYSVAGQAYTGERRRPSGDPSYRSHGAAAEQARAFEPGRPVRVYVDPADPTRACLEPGGELQAGLQFGFGAIFAAAGIGLLHRARRGAGPSSGPN